MVISVVFVDKLIFWEIDDNAELIKSRFECREVYLN